MQMLLKYYPYFLVSIFYFHLYKAFAINKDYFLLQEGTEVAQLGLRLNEAR